MASYWYSTVRRYNYFKDTNLLHTNVNAGKLLLITNFVWVYQLYAVYFHIYLGHFTQMVWVNTKYFGVGKATSHTGKIFVVAYYYPPGNYGFKTHMVHVLQYLNTLVF